VFDKLYFYGVEFPVGDVSKDSAAGGKSRPLDTKAESNGVIKKLLIESMLKSVQTVLKQQQPGMYVCQANHHVLLRFLHYLYFCKRPAPSVSRGPIFKKS